jgi:hypothetical protein
MGKVSAPHLHLWSRSTVNNSVVDSKARAELSNRNDGRGRVRIRKRDSDRFVAKGHDQ